MQTVCLARVAEMAEHQLCAIEDLADGGGRPFSAGGMKLALFRIGDEVFCVENICPHNGAALHDGILDKKDKNILCRWHYIAYDLESGGCVGNPKSRVANFPVEIRDGDVFVRLEDEA